VHGDGARIGEALAAIFAAHGLPAVVLTPALATIGVTVLGGEPSERARGAALAQEKG
jgi:hypothetical protein